MRQRMRDCKLVYIVVFAQDATDRIRLIQHMQRVGFGSLAI